MQLDPEQLAAVDRMVNEPTRAALNASQYGTGKTVVSVEVAHQVAGVEGVVLIVAPLFTKYSWKSCVLGQYAGSVVSFINSTKSGKIALQNLVNGKAGYYIIGRELFRTRKITEIIAPMSPKIDVLIYDECAAWANYKSLGYRNMKKMKPKYRMALSATPYANKFSGMFAITQWLWPQLDGHASYWKFVSEWCETEIDYYAGILVKGEKKPGEFVKHLPCYVRLEKDFGTPINLRYEIDLSLRERKIYAAFEKALVVWLQDNPLVAKFPIVKRLRLRQMTLGEVSVTEDGDVFFDLDMKSSKLDALLEILNEYDHEPALILTHSAKYAKVVAQRLNQAGHNALLWSGEVPETVRHEVKTAFMNADRCDYIVATIASIGEGVDGLQHRARLMIWLSREDNNMLNEQAFRRLFRRGQERQVVSVDVVARDTYDDGQLSNLIEQTLAMNASLREK